MFVVVDHFSKMAHVITMFQSRWC